MVISIKTKLVLTNKEPFLDSIIPQPEDNLLL